MSRARALPRVSLLCSNALGYHPAPFAPLPQTKTMPTRQLATSNRLDQVRYEIRGELNERALALEAAGRKILKLNIGNPAPFGFDAPEHLRAALRDNLERSEGYCHQKGLVIAREAVVRQQRQRGAANADVDTVFLGNGVSELIDIALRGLLNAGDE